MAYTDFSPEEWGLAPQYASPVELPGIVVLDFEQLGRMAREAEANGAFHVSDDGTLAKAPVFLEDLPAAFYKVEARDPDFTPNHDTSWREFLVVMEGALRIVSNHGGDRTGSDNLIGVLHTGKFMELEKDEAISMQAASLMNRATAWVLAIYRDAEHLIRPDVSLAQTRRGVLYLPEAEA
jgi:hypothetical protein